MTRHHKTSGKDCSSTVRIPPTTLWNSTQVVAFPNDHKYAASWNQCCGMTANLTMYNKRCFKFCDVNGNQTDVVDCLHDAGVKKATGFNDTGSGEDSEDEDGDEGKRSGVASIKAMSMSKSGLGLVLLVFTSLAVGTL